MCAGGVVAAISTWSTSAHALVAGLCGAANVGIAASGLRHGKPHWVDLRGKKVSQVLSFSRPAYNQGKLASSGERSSISGIQDQNATCLA